MSATLISLIGKSRLDPQTGYRTANYRYPDGTTRTEPFFGLGLKECIHPEKLILVGTRGSMWDVFFDHQNVQDESILALIDAVPEERVTQAMLTAPAQQLTERFGIPVQCLLIPYAENETEQAQILLELARAVEPGESIVLDVTHGFRHLPMLALVAARYLKYVRRVTIQDVYYGALEMTDKQNGVTPVLNLGGMLHMLDWVEALAVYEHSGDYGVFAELFQQDGMAPEHADQLRRAAFFERSTNPEKAREKLGGAINHIQNHSGALGQLFSAPLAENISWFKAKDRAERERELADRYLERRDYLRAVMFLQESFVSRAVWQNKGDPSNFDERKSALDEWRDRSGDFKFLANLRNAMAHGVRSADDNISRLLQNEEKLAQKLRQLRKSLFR